MKEKETMELTDEKTGDMTNKYNLGCYVGARNRRGTLVGKLVKSNKSVV